MSEKNTTKEKTLLLTLEELNCILRWAEEATKQIFSAYDGFAALTPLKQKVIDKLKMCEKEFISNE